MAAMEQRHHQRIKGNPQKNKRRSRKTKVSGPTEKKEKTTTRKNPKSNKGNQYPKPPPPKKRYGDEGNNPEKTNNAGKEPAGSIKPKKTTKSK